MGFFGTKARVKSNEGSNASSPGSKGKCSPKEVSNTKQSRMKSRLSGSLNIFGSKISPRASPKFLDPENVNTPAKLKEDAKAAEGVTKYHKWGPWAEISEPDAGENVRRLESGFSYHLSRLTDSSDDSMSSIESAKSPASPFSVKELRKAHNAAVGAKSLSKAKSFSRADEYIKAPQQQVSKLGKGSTEKIIDRKDLHFVGEKPNPLKRLTSSGQGQVWEEAVCSGELISTAVAKLTDVGGPSNSLYRGGIDDDLSGPSSPFTLASNFPKAQKKSLKINFAKPTSEMQEIKSIGQPKSPDKKAAKISAERQQIITKAEAQLPELRVFKFKELRVATSNFAPDQMIGVGGFGSVYVGSVKGCEEKVAIKKLCAQSLQGHAEWLAEVSLLGVVVHEHLVRLVGYCAERNHRLLVYELMPNASLDRHLFLEELPPLSWLTRVKIALGSARALHHLHEGTDFQVIYRDFKTSNVLLSEDFTAKLSDFGLAREGPEDGFSHVSTQVKGTEGYCAPEYLLTGHLTPKHDVWGFGICLLELFTGRAVIDPTRRGIQHNLVTFSKPYLKTGHRSFLAHIDPRLEGHYSKQSALMILQVAEACLQSHPNQRPRMSHVVKKLEQAVAVAEAEADVNISATGNPNADDELPALEEETLLPNNADGNVLAFMDPIVEEEGCR